MWPDNAAVPRGSVRQKGSAGTEVRAEFWTVAEAAHRFRVTKRNVRALMAKGEIPFVKFGARVLISRGWTPSTSKTSVSSTQ